MYRYCPKCRKVWEKTSAGIAFYPIPSYGRERQYCKFCLDKIPLASRVFLRKELKHGMTMNCPNCRMSGRYDKDGAKFASFDDSIWWDWQKEKFECINCFIQGKEISHEILP